MSGKDSMKGAEHFAFRAIGEEELNSLVTRREGETKLGERFAKDWRDPACHYVPIGICEDIGPRANNGHGGARNGFDAFLPAFVNMQANRFIDPASVHLLGRIDRWIRMPSWTSLPCGSGWPSWMISWSGS